MNKKIFSALAILTILSQAVFAAQGMSAWAGPGEVQNPDYVPRRPKATATKAEEKKEEPKKEEAKPVAKSEPKAEPKTEKREEPKKPVNDEYARSVGKLAISEDDFNADKNAIMRAIADLKVIMKNKDYEKWLTYIDQPTKDYWSKPANLKKLQTRLPRKGSSVTPIRSTEDVFKNFFIPARNGRNITEIRYDSPTLVRAVEIDKQSGGESSYYTFNKIDGKWLVNFVVSL